MAKPLLSDEQTRMVQKAMPLIALVARSSRYRDVPHLTADDLESAGGEAILAAVVQYDTARHGPFEMYVKACLRHVYAEEVRQARKRYARERTDDAGPNGELPVHVDRAAAEPLLCVIANEMIAPQGTGPLTHTLPGPDVVAARVDGLRAVMIDAIRVDQVRQMMATLGMKAAAGDTDAARMMIGLLGGQRAENVGGG